MQYEEFIRKVQEYAGIDSREDAVRAAEATLETLGERLTRKERDDLASQLPREIKEVPRRRQRAERFSLDEFLNRVMARADVGYPHAVKWSGAVLCVLQEAIAPGELEHILADLPAEYGELFGRKPKGPLSPLV
jgi:uncharacterized protein (DUF2267 family)